MANEYRHVRAMGFDLATEISGTSGIRLNDANLAQLLLKPTSIAGAHSLSTAGADGGGTVYCASSALVLYVQARPKTEIMEGLSRAKRLVQRWLSGKPNYTGFSPGTNLGITMGRLVDGSVVTGVGPAPSDADESKLSIGVFVNGAALTIHGGDANNVGKSCCIIFDATKSAADILGGIDRAMGFIARRFAGRTTSP